MVISGNAIKRFPKIKSDEDVWPEKVRTTVFRNGNARGEAAKLFVWPFQSFYSERQKNLPFTICGGYDANVVMAVLERRR